jgi:hypothetical protein
MSERLDLIESYEQAVSAAYEAARPALLAAPNSPYTKTLLQAWQHAEARRDSLLRRFGLLQAP